ncbi:MAG: hypothetical protein ACKPKO_26590, partial [Candidatus Fonsibacter sp.]
GDVPVDPLYMHDVLDIISVGSGSTSEVFSQGFEQLVARLAYRVYIYILDICLYDVVVGFNKNTKNHLY